MSVKSKEFIKKFMEDCQGFNWLTLCWRNFDSQCQKFDAGRFVDAIYQSSIPQLFSEYTEVKEKFINNWILLEEEEKKELKRIVNLDKTEYWDKYFNHEFDGREEEAMIEFFKSWENEINAFFNIK